MKKMEYIKNTLIQKIRIVLYCIILLFISSCEGKKDNIINHCYKGYGIFMYYPLESGSYYEIIFIPIKMRKTPKNEKDFRDIPKEYKKGLSFGSFRDEGILDDIFVKPKKCEGRYGSVFYKYVYIDFEEKPNITDDEKWYRKGTYEIIMCMDNNKKAIYTYPNTLHRYN